MNFDECTLLAGVPNAPTNYNPTASPELARQRQKQVIEKMKKAGYLENPLISMVNRYSVKRNNILKSRSNKKIKKGYSNHRKCTVGIQAEKRGSFYGRKKYEKVKQFI